MEKLFFLGGGTNYQQKENPIDWTQVKG
jgi:hypothetical protein